MSGPSGKHSTSRKWIRLTAIVAEREIRQRGRSRAFAVSTIVLLLVVAAAVVIPAIVAHTAKPQRVGIVGGQTAAMTGIVREAGVWSVPASPSCRSPA